MYWLGGAPLKLLMHPLWSGRIVGHAMEAEWAQRAESGPASPAAARHRACRRPTSGRIRKGRKSIYRGTGRFLQVRKFTRWTEKPCCSPRGFKQPWWRCCRESAAACCRSRGLCVKLPPTSAPLPSNSARRAVWPPWPLPPRALHCGDYYSRAHRSRRRSLHGMLPSARHGWRLFELSRACRHHHPPAHLHPTPAPQLPTCKQRSARASPRCARSDGGGGRWWTASGSRSKQRSCAIISTSSPTSPSSRPAQTSHRVPPHFPRSRSDSRGSLLVRCA